MSPSLATARWQECPAVPHFLPGTVEPIRPAPRAGPRIGLALGGGSARGWAHIGVLRALEEAGIHPTVVAGCSIGAVVGACYAAGRLDRLEAFARTLTRRRVVGLIDPRLPGSGLIAGNRLRQRLFADLGTRRIEDLPIRFGCVATEYGTGHEVSLTDGPAVDAVRASYAIPGLFPPVTHEGRVLMDGTLVNPVPVALARALGADLVICVNLNGDTGGPVVHEVPAPPPRRSFLQVMRGRLPGFESSEPEIPVPGLARVVLGAFNITQDRISRARLERDPPDVAIGPDVGSFGLFDFHKAAEGIAIGHRAARAALPRIRAVVEGAAARA
ncbi:MULTISPECIES: patatin-like phospholipase family protein [Methylobacterium]|uniref:Patatin-like phospholipase family protein n=1 Tax=Methylobacterium longum TaxID=767694 RepID=A0ABT8ASC7_9HYPH|nr:MULTISPECIES: patatin-like phospholipase family protein [Methylobacterium]MCJ2099146.1 patatin-like phospholipase family protein [Methylobacterium sp. E-046]MDN3572748.1 patatin-like phospholipase family protein [Methylobacterium longum]GJE10128.1 putative NTE family protein [Methylobacterium longum]